MAEEEIPTSLTRKRPRLLLVDSSLPTSTGGASSSTTSVAIDQKQYPSQRNSNAASLRIRLGNTCQRFANSGKMWTAFAEIAPSRVSWLQKACIRFTSGDGEISEDITSSESAGIYQSSPRMVQKPCDIHIELHWKPEFLESPRLSDFVHMLNFDEERTERIILVKARTQTVDGSPTGDDPQHDSPASQGQTHERLLTRFRGLFGRGLLANPHLFERRCQRLRAVAEAKLSVAEKLTIGDLTISSTQAEQLIQETANALNAAGHAVVIPVASTSVIKGSASTSDNSAAVEEEPMQLRGILRILRGPRSKTSKSTKSVCFHGDMPQPLRIECFKELRYTLWYDGLGCRAACDDCGAVKPGKLLGGTPGFDSTRDHFYCFACLHKLSLSDWEVSDVPRDTAMKSVQSKVSCEECKKTTEKAKYWYDHRSERHAYCEECWKQWEQRRQRW